MVSKEAGDDKSRKDFQFLVSKLNLDQNTASQAWTNYDQTRAKYTLEGDQLHWLGCSVYVACRSTITPTIGEAVLEGNCVSLTSLLRYSNLSLVHFFNKIKNWAEMTKMSEEFNRKIGNLQSKVAVAYNIFKGYSPIFTTIFNTPTDTDNRQHRNRKQKAPCTPSKIFEFCWLMFITAKGEDDTYSEDIVSSFHLLYACCDLAFKNAFLDERRDLLNPNFPVLPEDWTNPDYRVPNEAPCIISTLSQADGNILTNAKYMKEYNFKHIIKDWFDKGILQGNHENFTGLFNPSVFDANYKSITKEYETHLLNKGDFDERIFLAEYRRQLLLKEQAYSNGSFTGYESGEQMESPRIFGNNEAIQQCFNTPLTGRRFLGPKDVSDTNSTGNENISRIQNLLVGRGPVPSDELQNILKYFFRVLPVWQKLPVWTSKRSCAEDPTENIKAVLERLSTKFCTRCIQQYNNEFGERTEVNKRLQISITLFYKFLENILVNEKTRLQDISPLVQKVIFFECLFVCSLEIIEFSYNASKKFPWILSAVEVSALDFVKVIELTIRSGDQLPRNIVKHLNWVEERILESILWKSDSALWQAIENSGGEIPKFEDIALPGNMEYSRQNSSKPKTNTNLTQSPGPSAVETFQSPNGNIPLINSQVKKKLFSTVKPGQSLLQNAKPTHLLVTDEEGNRKYVKLMDTSNIEPVLATPSPVPDVKPKKGGSLSIVFRKFYNLAGVRMDHLCIGLGLTSLELKCKIWTIFEYAVRHTDLMKDRHLDQLLMCSVYVISKLTQTRENFFTDIMRRYREQPQSSSYIYRHVLSSRRSENSGNQGEARVDLISFYNNDFVLKVKDFALRFSSNSNQINNVHLSPIPLVSSIVASPRQQITKNVFIKVFESPTNLNGAGNRHNYYFSRSASKDLKNINNAINTNISLKRLLDNYEDVPNKRPANRKVATLLEERKTQSMDAE